MRIMIPVKFFSNPQSVYQKQYEALRCYFIEKKPAKEVAEIFGYKYRGFTTIVSRFKANLDSTNGEGVFFLDVHKGRKIGENVTNSRTKVIELRKQYHSVEEIQVILNSQGIYTNLTLITDFHVILYA